MIDTYEPIKICQFNSMTMTGFYRSYICGSFSFLNDSDSTFYPIKIISSQGHIYEIIT